MVFADLWALSTDRNALIIFFAVLPLINGLYDALSYALTLALSRKGLSTRWAPLWALADLALGAMLLLALGATMVVVVAALNAVGSAPIYDLVSLFAGLRTNPEEYWWLYLILFSTLAPTALHLLVAALAVQGWFVFLRPRSAVANWIATAPISHPAAVGGLLGQTMIWWLPLIALSVLAWAAWQFIGVVAGAAGLRYKGTNKDAAPSHGHAHRAGPTETGLYRFRPSERSSNSPDLCRRRTGSVWTSALMPTGSLPNWKLQNAS
ncbi:hypothetical protein [Roseinatronobacter sp.]